MNNRAYFVPRWATLALVAVIPFLTGARGEGCGGGSEGEQITPDVSGQWALSYDNDLQVEIKIGGAVYNETIGAQGGIVSIDHEGQPIEFNLDCSRPAVVCPSEVWPASVTLDQKDENAPRNVYVTIPTSECDGNLVEPDPSECGADTNNEECNKVCDGSVTVTDKETFGRISFSDDELVVFLGAGVATNGLNCALLGLSVAQTDLETTGSAADGDWEAVAMPNGEIITGYAGGCLWAGDPNDDGTIQALVIGGSVKLSTGFSGTKQ